MKVLISGAGIGSLAAARALVADGHEVTVFEQAAELRHGGAAAHSFPPTRAQGANQSLEDAWALAAALRAAAKERTDTEAALRAFECARSRKASVVSRQAGSEDYNRYGAILTRLLPSPLATRYYTRWLRQISTYLDPAPRGAR